MLSGDETNKEQWKRYDWEFHLAMIQACNSRNLLSLHATLFDKYLRYQMLVLTHRGEIAAQEHRAMFEAALARDAAKAQAILETHIRNGLSHAMAAFS
jgi:DNA-binding GntR family transcriptional regulator